MMEAVFIKVVNMSISAGWLILAVLLLRLLLKKAPRWTTVVLWGIVGLRLVLPFSLQSVFSLIPSAEVVSPSIGTAQHPEINSGVSVIDNAVNPTLSTSLAATPMNSVNPMQIVLFLGGIIWTVGIAILLLYGLISYLRLRRKVAEAIPYEKNTWLCDQVKTPFILGVFHPRIYLPSGLNEEETAHVLAHEHAHLKRKDHLWKPLGFLLLTVYWFNPLIWVAYILLCRDIEAACDEKVISDMEMTEKKAYANALVSCSMQRRLILACPLAFGEVGVKERVKGVLNYRKPAFWIIVAALIACVVIAVCFLTNPKDDAPDLSFLNYKNAIPLIGQNDTAPYANLYPADSDGVQPGVADGKALIQLLESADWTQRRAPSSSPEPRGFIEFLIEDDYRIILYQSERLAAVRFGNDVRYYRTAAGDYEAALTTFIPAPSTEPDRTTVPTEKTELFLNNPLAFLQSFANAEIITRIDNTGRLYPPSEKTFDEIVSSQTWTAHQAEGFPSSDPDRLIEMIYGDWELRIEEDGLGCLYMVFPKDADVNSTVTYLDCGANLMDELMPWALQRVVVQYYQRTLTAAEESVVEVVLSDVMWLETPYALSDYTEGQMDGVPELCSLIEGYAYTHRLSMDQMRGLLLGTEGLDGAYAEAYANLLSGLHRYQPLQFDEAYYLTDGSVKAFLPSIFGLNDPDPEATLQNECAFFASLYSMTWRWLRANYGLDYELIAPSISEMELVQLQKAADNTNWLSDNIRPEYPDWSVAVPVEKGGSSKTSGTLTLYYFAQSETEAALIGYSFIENPIPLMTVESGGISIEPFSVQLNERDWTEAVQRAIDAGNEIPRLTLAGDFDAHFQRSVRKGRLQIYGEDFRPLITDAYGDTALLWLAPGSYYAAIEVYGPWASRVSGDAYRCVFRLDVPAGRPTPFEPTEARDLTEARLHWRGRDYVITDADALAQLEGWLRNAEAMPGGAACPFGSVLTLTRADGSCFSCCPAEDSCSVVYADGTYYQYAHDNEDFWALFGIEQWW